MPESRASHSKHTRALQKQTHAKPQDQAKVPQDQAKSEPQAKPKPTAVVAYRHSEVDVDSITLDTDNTIIISRRDNRRLIPAIYRNEPLPIESPYVQTETDLVKTEFPDIYQIDTLFVSDSKSKSKMRKWFDFNERLESQMSTLVAEQGANWFTGTDVCCKSLIREKDGVCYIRWPVNLRTCQFVDERGNTIDPSQIRKGDFIKMVILVPDIWIRANCYGITAKTVMIKHKPQKVIAPREFRFNETDSSESSSLDDDEDNIISLLATEQGPRVRPNRGLINAQQAAPVLHPSHIQDQRLTAFSLPVLASRGQRQSKTTRAEGVRFVDTHSKVQPQAPFDEQPRLVNAPPASYHPDPFMFQQPYDPSQQQYLQQQQFFAQQQAQQQFFAQQQNQQLPYTHPHSQSQSSISKLDVGSDCFEPSLSTTESDDDLMGYDDDFIND